MKITIDEFLALPHQEQYDIVFTAGDYLEIMIQGRRGFILYAVDRFFVEIEYENEKYKLISNKAFVAGELLDKYTASAQKLS